MKLKITFLFLLFTTVFYAQTLIISDSGDVGAYESPTIASKTVGAAQFFSGSDATSNRLSTLADASFNSVEETSSLTLSNNIADTFYNQTVNNSLFIDGVDDYVELDHSPITDGATEFTIELWINPDGSNFDDTDYHGFIGYQGTDVVSARNPSLWLKEGKIHLDAMEDGTLARFDLLTERALVTQDRWTHVALVKDGTEFRVYLDGALAVTTVAPNKVNISTDTYHIGRVNNYFSGSVDEVRFWNDVRTETEINALMNIPAVGNEPGLLAYYDFNQGVPGANNTSLTTLVDKTSGNNLGTITSMALTGNTSNWVSGFFPKITSDGFVYTSETTTLTHSTSGGTWSVDNSSLATISSNGVLNGLSAGQVVVTYAFGSSSTSMTVDVVDASNLGGLTIVASGGVNENSGWSYSNGVIRSTSSAAVNLNAADVLSKLNINHLTIEASSVTVNADINSTYVNDLTLKATGNIIQENGVLVTTAGGNVTYWSDSDDNGIGAIQLKNSGIIGGSVTTNGGNITMGGGTDPLLDFAMANNTTTLIDSQPYGGVWFRYASLNAGGGNIIINGSNGSLVASTRGIYSTETTIQTSGTGTITLNGDGGSSTGATNPWGISTGTTTIQSESGNIFIYGISNATNAGNERGMALGGYIQSASGDIYIEDKTTSTTQTNYAAKFNGIYMPVSIGKGTLPSSSSNVYIRGNEIQTETSTAIETTGNIEITPSTGETSFTNTLFWAGENTASKLIVGNVLNTADITLAGDITTTGSITVYGGDIAVNGDLNTTGASDADILLKASDNIILASSKSIVTDGGDVVFWSDSDSNGGYINIKNNATIDTRTASDRTANNGTLDDENGGSIILGGGAGTTSPTGYAHSNTGVVGAGILLGESQNSGVSITSGGGDISLKGKSDTGNGSGESNGIFTYGGFSIEAGKTGNISLDGQGENGNYNAGIYTSYTLSAGNNLIKTVDGDISLTGISNGGGSNGDRGILLLAGNSSSTTIETTGTGSITIDANSGTYTNTSHDIFTQNEINILAKSGAIQITGNGSGNIQPNNDLTLGYKSGSDVTSSTSDITLTENTFNFTSGIKFNTSGTLTIKPTDGNSFASTFDTSSLSYSLDVSGLTIGHTDNAGDVTIGSNTFITGDIKLYGGDISVNGSLNTSSVSGGDILLKASKGITQVASTSIITDGGDVVLWANSDGETSNGEVILESTSSISTSNGNLWIGGSITSGGSTLWNGLTVGDGYATSGEAEKSWYAGVFLDEVSLNTDGGDIYIAGKNITKTIGAAGFISHNGNTGTSINSGSGTIEIKGVNENSSSPFGIMFGLHPTTYNGDFKLTSSSDDTTAINLYGSAKQEDGILIEDEANIIATGTGIVLITGESTSQKGLSLGNSANWGVFNILSSTGDITLDVGNTGIEIVNASGVNSTLTMGTKSGTGVTSSQSNISLISDYLSLSNLFFDTSGTVTIKPVDTKSFTSTFDTSNISYSSDVSGLTIGHTDNTGDIIIGNSSTIAGDISLYGGNITINNKLEATNSTITLGASGTVTDGSNGYMVADNLVFLEGTITLDNSSNDLGIIAGSNLDAVSFQNSDALEIGSVSSINGISSTGTIEIATLSGDIKLNEPIVSTKNSGDAVILYADKNATAGNAGNGNITISNNGTATIESGARALMYSGVKDYSTRLTTEVGGNSNTRLGVDKDTSLTSLNPTVASIGKFALFRELYTDLSISDISVTEDSGYAIFSLRGSSSDYVSLFLNNDSAIGLGVNYGAGNATNLEYFIDNSNNWAAYENYVQIPASGVLKVRTPIIDDSSSNANRTFKLVVKPIYADLGSITVYDVNNSTINLSGLNLISGTDEQVNAVYLKTNAITINAQSIDVKVTIIAKSNVNSYTFDSDSSNSSRFQSTINSSSSSGSFVDYKMEFFKSGTAIPVALNNFNVSGVDIDGNSSSSREYIEISNFSSYSVDATSGLTVAVSPVNSQSIRFTGLSNSLSGIDFEDTAAFIANYESPLTEFVFRKGVTGASSSARQFSLAFGSAAGAFSNIINTANDDSIIATATITDDELAQLNVLENLNAFTSCGGSSSEEQTFTVSGSNLTDDIIVTAPANWEVSTSAGFGFLSTVTLTQTGGLIATTPLYIRVKNDAASGNISGNISISSTGATAETISVAGVVNQGTVVASSAASSLNVNDVSITVDDAIVVNGTGTVTNAQVFISSGFLVGDVLEYTATLPSGVTKNYNTTTGVLTFTGTISLTDLQPIFRNIHIKTTVNNTQDRIVTFLAGNALPFADNNHYYEFKTARGISWSDAKAAAEALTFNGLQGYLATITSAEENAFIASKLAGQGWFGAADLGVEGQWKWMTGPEAGTQFWQGTSSGSSVGGLYENWASREPNDYGAGEDYAHFLTSGEWNDYPLSTNTIAGYVVEYGGMTNDACVSISDTKTVHVTIQPSFNNNSSTISSFTSCVGLNSEEQTFTVSGTNLTDDIIIAAPANWEVSTSAGSGFLSTVTLTQTGGVIAATPIYIRVKDDAASGNISGNVSISSTGATAETITLAGVVNLVPQPLSVSNSLCEANGLEWVSFTSSDVSSTTGKGTLFGNITATVTHSDGGMQSWYMYNQTSFPSEYNVPTSNNIRNDKAGTFTISFSEPVTNPQVAFASIGNPRTPVGINTSVPYQVIWNGLAMDYSTSTSMTGNEGFTIVSFPGTHSSLTFDYLNDEAYVTMAFGAQNPNCNNITICEGDSVTLTASGGSTYEWTPNSGLNTTSGAEVIASPSVTTTYSVIDTSNSCATPTEVVVTVLPASNAPTVSLDGTQLICTGDTIADLEATALNGQPIEWFASPTGGTALTASTTLVGGTTYYAQSTNTNGCSSARASLTAVTNNALHFDGVNDYVVVGDKIENLSDITSQAWVYWEGSSISFSEIFTKDLISSMAITSSNKLHANFGNGTSWNGAGLNSTTSIPLNKWTHLTVTRSNGVVKMFINGVEDSSTHTNNATGANNAPRVIGGKVLLSSNTTTNTLFSGKIDEVRFWNVAKTQAEILANITTDLAGDETGLLAYYNFNQGIANGTNTSVTTITDLTSNANTGTLNNLSLASTSSNWVKGYFTEITGDEEVILGGTLQLQNLTSDGVWSSSDVAVATISQTGLVTPITPGVTTISYTYCGVTTTHQVTVNGYPTISAISDQSNCPNTETNAFTFSISDLSTPLVDLVLTGTSSNTNLIPNTAIVFSGSASNRTVTITPITGQLGASTISITVTNDYNLKAVETFVLTIEDLIDPTVTTAPVAVAVNTDADLPTASNVTLGTPVFSDNCGTPTVTNDAPTVFPIGVTTVTWTATDAAGNTVTATQAVTVTDNQKPVISDTPSGIAKNNDTGLCGAVITWTAPTASDNATVATFVSTHNSGDTFPVGTTTVSYTATDSSGNKTTSSFEVMVTDTEKPVITNTPAAISQNNDVGVNVAVVTWTLPTASDNCAIATFVSSKESGDEFPIGTTIVTYTATDSSGNKTTTSFNVTVTDNQKPVISDTPSDIAKNNDTGLCGAVITWTAPTASDNAAVATFVSTHNSGDMFPVGTTIVSYTATDSSGNKTTSSFEVIVTDTEKPVVVTSPSITNIDYVSSSSQCGAIITWTEPVVSDNCAIATIVKTHDSGDLFLEGDTTITYTIKDVNGNETSTSFVVTVEPSMIDCDGDGVSNAQEYIDNTDSQDFCSAISSSRTMTVSQEFLAADCDGDGLSNEDEIGLDIKNPLDSDNDGLADYLEFNNHKASADDLEVFNLLTPNGDGENDVFVIRNIELYPENSLEIYNRWGTKVYDVKSYGQNGRYFTGLSEGRVPLKKSSLLPSGTYFYILRYTSKSGKQKNRKGYLYLTR